MALADGQRPAASNQYNNPAPAQQYRQNNNGYQEPNYGPAQYNFDWAVQDDYSGNNYGHNEERNGDLTSGSYYVNLPDGRLQRVTYTVDGYGGYQAEVTYEGEAQYPQHQQSQGYAPAPKPTQGYAPQRPAPTSNRYNNWIKPYWFFYTNSRENSHIPPTINYTCWSRSLFMNIIFVAYIYCC